MYAYPRSLSFQRRPRPHHRRGRRGGVEQRRDCPHGASEGAQPVVRERPAPAAQRRQGAAVATHPALNDLIAELQALPARTAVDPESMAEREAAAGQLKERLHAAYVADPVVRLAVDVLLFDIAAGGSLALKQSVLGGGTLAVGAGASVSLSGCELHVFVAGATAISVEAAGRLTVAASRLVMPAFTVQAGPCVAAGSEEQRRWLRDGAGAPEQVGRKVGRQVGRKGR